MKLWDKIKGIESSQYYTDYWASYGEFIPKEKHVQSKAETYTIEGYNSRIGKLDNLTSLHLSSCNQLTDVTPLGQLAKLTSLGFSGCDRLTNVTPLGELAKLTSLELSFCRKITEEAKQQLQKQLPRLKIYD